VKESYESHRTVVGEAPRSGRVRTSLADFRNTSNNIVEQDHRRIRRLLRPGLGFGSFWTARRTLAGFEAMAMIRKGQLRNIGGRDMRAQASVIAELFEIAA